MSDTKTRRVPPCPAAKVRGHIEGSPAHLSCPYCNPGGLRTIGEPGSVNSLPPSSEGMEDDRPLDNDDFLPSSSWEKKDIAFIDGSTPDGVSRSDAEVIGYWALVQRTSDSNGDFSLVEVNSGRHLIVGKALQESGMDPREVAEYMNEELPEGIGGKFGGKGDPALRRRASLAWKSLLNGDRAGNALEDIPEKNHYRPASPMEAEVVKHEITAYFNRSLAKPGGVTCPITKEPLDSRRSVFLVNQKGSVVGGCRRDVVKKAYDRLSKGGFENIRYYDPKSR